MEKLAQFDWERITERVIHAKGSGAYGVFKTIQNISQFTKAGFLKTVGKEIEVFVRFSTVAGKNPDHHLLDLLLSINKGISFLGKFMSRSCQYQMQIIIDLTHFILPRFGL